MVRAPVRCTTVRLVMSWASDNDTRWGSWACTLLLWRVALSGIPLACCDGGRPEKQLAAASGDGDSPRRRGSRGLVGEAGIEWTCWASLCTAARSTELCDVKLRLPQAEGHCLLPLGTLRRAAASTDRGLHARQRQELHSRHRHRRIVFEGPSPVRCPIEAWCPRLSMEKRHVLKVDSVSNETAFCVVRWLLVS
ncbi:hypothetical protein DIPPA_12215 [Diplonema papillatum]|nr:hypothetical protein DIPPA_12215 [Diplonema papillatum]